MNKKYEFTGETMKWRGRILQQIRAVRTIPNTVIAGDLGGWVESESNLSQEDNAWVFDKAKVYGTARVYDNAQVYGNARVGADAGACGNAEIFGNALVYSKAVVLGNAKVCGRAIVCDDAQVYEHALVCGNARVCGSAILRDGKNDIIKSYICIGPVGSRNAFTTLNLISGTVCTECFKGSIDAFAMAVEKTHGYNTHARDYAKLISCLRMYITQ